MRGRFQTLDCVSGKIDEILSNKSEDRRHIFEEAAGISRFRHRKEDAQRKLERTDENLVRINDKLGELELQVEPLRKQSETAEKYLLLREELRGLEIAVWLDALEHIRSSKVKLDAGYQEALHQREKAKTAQEKSFSAAEEYASQMRNKDMQAEAERQAAILKAEGEAEAIREVQQALADSLKMLNEAAPADAVLKLKAIEAMQRVADGQATKIIIPSEMQGLVGLANGIVEGAGK